MAHLSTDKGSATPRRRRRKAWLLLLGLPYVALCFPQMYTRVTPVLWGFPFFYWYQLAWVLITSAILGTVYRATKAKELSTATDQKSQPSA